MNRIKFSVSVLLLFLVTGFACAKDVEPVSSLIKYLDSTLKYSFEAISYQKDLESVLDSSASYLSTLNVLLVNIKNMRQEKKWEQRFLCHAKERNLRLSKYLSNLNMPVKKEENVTYLRLIASMMGKSNSALDFMIKSWNYSCPVDSSAQEFRDRLDSLK